MPTVSGPKYVQQFPSENVLALVSLIRNKELVSRRQEAAKHYWLTESYLWFVTVGEPGGSPIGEKADSPATAKESAVFEAMSDEEKLDSVESLAVSDGTKGAGGLLMTIALKWLINYLVSRLLPG